MTKKKRGTVWDGIRDVGAFLVVLVLLGATSSAVAGNTAASDVEGCRAASGRMTAAGRVTLDQAFDRGVCMGLVEALLWSLPATGVSCLPKGLTTGQRLKVLVKYMDDHPEQLRERTAQL